MTKCLNVDMTPSMAKEHGRGGYRNMQNGYRINISLPAIPDAFSPTSNKDVVTRLLANCLDE